MFRYSVTLVCLVVMSVTKATDIPPVSPSDFLALKGGFALTSPALGIVSSEQQTITTSELSTVKPQSTFPDNTGKWSVENSTPGSTCIAFEAAIQLNISVSVNTTLVVDVPSAAQAWGSCGNLTQNISLEWYNETLLSTLALTFDFELGSATNKYAIKSIVLSGLNYSAHVTDNSSTSVYNIDIPIGMSFKCNSELNWKTTNSIVHIKNLQYEAFRPESKAGMDFSIAEHCSTDSEVITAIIGWVIVGIVTGIFVLVVGFYTSCHYKREGCGCSRILQYRRLERNFE